MGIALLVWGAGMLALAFCEGYAGSTYLQFGQDDRQT